MISCSLYRPSNKTIKAISDLKSNYSNEFQLRHLSKFEDSLEKIYKSNQEYCKL